MTEGMWVQPLRVGPFPFIGATPDPEEVTGYAELILAEIRKDQASGVVPVSVRTYSGLQDYVNANMYVIDVLAGVFPRNEDEDETPVIGGGPSMFSDDETDMSNAVTDRVNGMLREVHGFRCPCCGDDVVGVPPVCGDCVNAGCAGRLSRVERDPGYWDCQRTDTDPE